MKKIALLLMALVLAATFTVSAGGANETSGQLKVGMVTDSGTIDDKSFNQGTWEGILMATDEFDVDSKYLKPVGVTEAEYLQEIGNLYDGGYKFIVTPGFLFESTVFAAQAEYEDAYFVLIDGYPHSGDYNPVVGPNTVSIFFAEQESGFLAGLAAALQMQDAEFGFIGGMEIPAVQRFNWGFQQGIAYANATYGTSIVLDAENVIYQGSFSDVAAGQQIAAQMYDKGVDVIFTAAGGVGVGAINEAKSRARGGEEVWIIGVDVDQYADGIYEGEMSIILTSAVKRVDQAAFEMIKLYLEGAFPGGQILTLDAAADGVGIPAVNPNLDADVQATVEEVKAMIVSGDLMVSAEQGNLIK